MTGSFGKFTVTPPLPRHPGNAAARDLATRTKPPAALSGIYQAGIAAMQYLGCDAGSAKSGSNFGYPNPAWSQTEVGRSRITPAEICAGNCLRVGVSGMTGSFVGGV